MEQSSAYKRLDDDAKRAYHSIKANTWRERHRDDWLESQRRYYAKNAVRKRLQAQERYHNKENAKDYTTEAC
jgi:hypothetical protein